MAQLDDFIGQVPPITRCYLGLAATMMALCSLDLLSPFNLYLNWNLVLQRGELWRLLSCFLFFGEFSMHFFWNVYMLMFYCSSLEEEGFRGRAADFVWFLLSTASIVLGLSYIFGAGIFFGGAMLNVMTYVWSRKNPHARMGVFFFAVDAPYLPWVFCAISLLVGWGLSDHLYGIAAGHLYYFFEDIYPLMPTSNNFRLFKTPAGLRWILNQKDDD